MRFVAVKTADQQAHLALHRIRAELNQQRTAQINQLRGLLAEFGLILPKGRHAAQREIPALLEDADNNLPPLARRLLSDVYRRIQQLNADILAYDRELEQLAREDAKARQLLSIPGIGSITATATLATIVDPQQFRNGRQLAAWLGLTPKQYSTGGVTRLGHITKRGDTYLRTLLIHGARAVIAKLGDKTDRLSVWLRALVARRGFKLAAVALAAKNARILWALLTHGGTYQTFAV